MAAASAAPRRQSTWDTETDSEEDSEDSRSDDGPLAYERSLSESCQSVASRLTSAEEDDSGDPFWILDEGLSQQMVNEFHEEVKQKWQKRVTKMAMPKAPTDKTDMYGSLDVWRELLKPFPWSKVTTEVMRDVLTKAGLPSLSKTEKIVRAYEILRCLGSDIYEKNFTDTPEGVANIEQHMKSEGVTSKQDEQLRNDVQAYIQEICGDAQTQSPLRKLESELGFALGPLKSNKMQDVKELAILVPSLLCAPRLL